MKKLVLALLTSLAVVLGIAGPAAAAYPPNAPTVSVSTSTPAPGGEFTVTAEGCNEGDVVTFEFEGETKTAVVVGGIASVTFTAPETPGFYTGTVTCGGVASDFGITVVSPTAPGGGLPSTGSDGIGATTTIAIGLLAVGLGLFGVATVRRRRTVGA
jgi:hypothetical protein